MHIRIFKPYAQICIANNFFLLKLNKVSSLSPFSINIGTHIASSALTLTFQVFLGDLGKVLPLDTFPSVLVPLARHLGFWGPSEPPDNGRMEELFWSPSTPNSSIFQCHIHNGLGYTRNILLLSVNLSPPLAHQPSILTLHVHSAPITVMVWKTLQVHPASQYRGKQSLGLHQSKILRFSQSLILSYIPDFGIEGMMGTSAAFQGPSTSFSFEFLRTLSSSSSSSFFFFFCLFVFLGLHLRHMEVPRLGV